MTDNEKQQHTGDERTAESLERELEAAEALRRELEEVFKRYNGRVQHVAIVGIGPFSEKIRMLNV